jgi:carbon storage regulator
MLVLSRKIGERIVINGTVRVTVLGLRGGRVRLGVEAPAAVPVHQAEVRARRAESWAMPAYAALGAAVDASEFQGNADLTQF